MAGCDDLRDFLRLLEREGDLRRIGRPIDPRLEVTEVCRRVLHAGGPALLFEHPVGAEMPLLGNLFGTTHRVALGVGRSDVGQLRELGETLAALREPEPPRSLRTLVGDLALYSQALNLPAKRVRRAPFQALQAGAGELDLAALPVPVCWPEDAGPLITWAMVVTRGPDGGQQNVGIYRLQVIGRNRVILRWLAHRGGALHHQAWLARRPADPFPVAVAIGADPASLLAAVTPVPESLGEFQFAGLLRGARTAVVALRSGLQVPASSEIVLEGVVRPGERAPEGPFGDHTGYYNEVETFPVLSVERLWRRKDALYLSTYTGRPPDEPAVLGEALNELFVPLLRKQFPEIGDFHLPPEACSYRIAVVSLRKAYPGHAKRLMMGIWSYLRQFLYTKFIIVVDDDVDPRNWTDVIWAVSTRCDPVRDLTTVERTPIDYLDFAAPRAALGGKLGLDATNKLPGEVDRPWGRPIIPDPAVAARIDALWADLGL